MQFLDDSLLPENQEKLVITVAPYGPEWEPADFPEDIPVSMEEQCRRRSTATTRAPRCCTCTCARPTARAPSACRSSTSCWRACARAVPDMILQVGGSISFSPEGDGAEAKWLSDDTRHMLADLSPRPTRSRSQSTPTR